MAFWKKKEQPRYNHLIGHDLLDEVVDLVSPIPLRCFCDPTCEMGQNILSRLAQDDQGGAVFIVGPTTFYTSVISSLEEIPTTIIFWQTSFLDAARLLPREVPIPNLTIYDTTLYLEEQDVLGGVAHLISLGISCDRGLFDLVYSSFTKEGLLNRAVPMLLEMRMAEEDGSEIRTRLTFGHTMARALFTLGEGELTYEEALACGMLLEARAGVRAGRVPLRLYQDLDGVISYLGLPREYVVEPAALQTVMADLYGDTLTLHLPKKKGMAAPYETTLTPWLTLLQKSSV